MKDSISNLEHVTSTYMCGLVIRHVLGMVLEEPFLRPSA